MTQAITDSKQASAALAELFGTHKRVVFFGGAGVSTASGIPDFRSVDGLYHQQFAYPPETMLSHSFYEAHPAEFFDFYRTKMIALGAKPNRCHTRLAELERAGKLNAVVTQNIDGLHQMAGSQRVFELHGSVHRNVCQTCGAVYSAEWICSREHEDAAGVPVCPACGGRIKPDVVLYEEPLDEHVLTGAVAAIAKRIGRHVEDAHDARTVKAELVLSAPPCLAVVRHEHPPKMPTPPSLGSWRRGRFALSLSIVSARAG